MNTHPMEQFLADAQAVLRELDDVQQEKLRALARLDAAALEELSRREGQLTSRLRELGDRRELLLASSRVPDPSQPSSLRSLLAEAAPDTRERLKPVLDDVHRRGRRLRQQAAVAWLAVWRCHQDVGEVLRLFNADQNPGSHRQPGLVLDRTA